MWREAFLRRLMQIGGEELLEATSRVWSLLEPPKLAPAAAIGIVVGALGKGKKAIHDTLGKFMDDRIGDMSLSAIPAPGDLMGAQSGALITRLFIKYKLFNDLFVSFGASSGTRNASGMIRERPASSWFNGINRPKFAD